MAISIKDYKKIRSGLYQHIADAKTGESKQRWLIKARVNSKQVSKIFTLTKDTADNMELHAMTEKKKFLEEKDATSSEETQDLDHYFEEWRKSKRTWGDSYRYGIKKSYDKHIKPSLGSKLLKDIKTSDITKVLNKGDLSLRTQKTITEILFPLFKYVKSNKYIKESPIVDEHIVTRDSSKEKKKVQDAPGKYKKVYDAINTLESPRDRAMMLLGFHGRRKTEALTLRWEDISGNTYTIRKEVNKVNEDMTYTLPDDVKKLLNELKKECNGTGYIFESSHKAGSPITDIRDIVAKVRKSCGLDEFGYHWMRNLAVSALYQSGKATSEDLSAMLGHNDLNTLKKYLTDDKRKATKRTTAASTKLLGGVK